MKGNLRIILALILGIFVVGVVYINKPPHQETITIDDVVVTKPDTRQYIPIQDTNNDGVSDWEEQFITQVTTIDSSETSVEIGPYTPPNTLTDQFAQNFFSTYITANTNGTLTAENQDLFIQTQLNALTPAVHIDQYTPDNIRTVDSSVTSLREYGNTIASHLYLYSKDSVDVNEILKEALTNNDGKILTELTPIASGYKNFRDSALATPVPQILEKDHLDLINAYDAIRVDLNVFEKALEDPLLFSLQANLYHQNIIKLQTTLTSIFQIIARNGIYYSDTEPAEKLKKDLGLVINI